MPDQLMAVPLQGLRTLVVAGKVLEEDEWAAWDARYQQAAADLERRDELVRQGLGCRGSTSAACVFHACAALQASGAHLQRKDFVCRLCSLQTCCGAMS